MYYINRLKDRDPLDYLIRQREGLWQNSIYIYDKSLVESMDKGDISRPNNVNIQ